jgi:hypothetical protein
MRPRMQRVHLVAATAVSGALLLPLAVFAGTGFAKSSSAAQYQYKITICHHTHSAKNPLVTISVSVNAWPAHKRHGDTIGACVPPAATTTVASPNGNEGKNRGHGNSANHDDDGGHGNSGGHGEGHDK